MVALVVEAGFAVRLASPHPHGRRLWDEFHAPHFHADGTLRRTELASVIVSWRAHRERLGLGVVVAVKP